VEKLRPEQRKLWRKTYHQERDRGVEPSVAATRADDAVKAWEDRGAFDEDASETAYMSPSAGTFPGGIDMARDALARYGLLDDLAIAIPKEPQAFTLIAWTTRGHQLIEMALGNGFGAMLLAAQR